MAETLFMKSRVSEGFIPEDGSSSRSSDGRAARAMPTSSRRLLAVRQVGRRLLAPVGQAHLLQDGGGLRTQVAFLGLDARQRQQDFPDPAAAAAVQADQHVVEDAQPAEQAGLLESAHDAEVGDLVGPQAVQRRPAVTDAAGAGPQETRDDVEGGGLAGPVGNR